MMHARKQQSGFSLIELALVLGLVSIFLGFGLEALTTSRDIDAAEVTVKRMERIQRELDIYGGNRGRYPCPAKKNRRPNLRVNDGFPEFGEEVSSCNTSSSDYLRRLAPGIAEGAVPVRALNLPDDHALDGWGNKFTYVVTIANAQSNGYLTASGAITVRYGTPSANRLLTSDAAYVLLSHGANGAATNGGATGGKETSWQSCDTGSGSDLSPDRQNCRLHNAQNTFYEAPRNMNQLNTTALEDDFFDDFILWRVAYSDL